MSKDDAIWRALGDPTRRKILDLLRMRPMTTGEVASHFEATRFGVMKHLGVLEEAGLVLVRRKGRERFNHLNPVPIRLIYERWMAPFAEMETMKITAAKRFIEQKGKQDEDK